MASLWYNYAPNTTAGAAKNQRRCPDNSKVKVRVSTGGLRAVMEILEDAMRRESENEFAVTIGLLDELEVVLKNLPPEEDVHWAIDELEYLKTRMLH